MRKSNRTCEKILILCVFVCAVRMKVMRMVSLSSSPLHPRLRFSLPSWQLFSPSPMMTRRTLGVATSTRCYPIRTDPVLSTRFTSSLVSSRCVGPPTPCPRMHQIAHCTFYVTDTCSDMYFDMNSVRFSLLSPAHSKEIWLDYPRFGAVSRWWAPANGKPVPQLPRGHDLQLSVPYSLTGCRDSEFETFLKCYKEVFLNLHIKRNFFLLTED